MQIDLTSTKKNKLISFLLLVIIAIAVGGGAYIWLYQGRILPNVYVDGIKLGGLTKAEAREVLVKWQDDFLRQGIKVYLPATTSGQTEVILPSEVGFNLQIAETVEKAYLVGRKGNILQRIWSWLFVLGKKQVINPQVDFDENELEVVVEQLASVYDKPKVDVRYQIEGSKVLILTNKQKGLLLNQQQSIKLIKSSLVKLSSGPIELPFVVDLPAVDPTTIETSLQQAQLILSDELILKHKQRQFVLEPKQIGQWILSDYDDNRLVPKVDKLAVSTYVAELASKINTLPQDLVVEVKDNKVVKFIPPQPGIVLDEDATVNLIVGALMERMNGASEVKEIVLPVVTKKPLIDKTAEELGIRELLGKATTSFASSPPNRVWNIKNGTKFLNGILIAPGEEFSTVKSLGRIDNTTGYLPELVIKGDRTVPEFGGGLCQVSTTLFRAVLDAGLPVTARRNHSYRVSYYETDGEGNYIGPGLDATIYSPQPDFRFRNDTTSTILVIGYVEGDKVTFELYGTSDGRKSEVDGPYTLSTIPPGDPIYAETDTLAPGEKKKLESAHPGGSAIATYKVYYPNGEVKEQVFKSYYRPWPERWLIGKAKTDNATSTSQID